MRFGWNGWWASAKKRLYTHIPMNHTKKTGTNKAERTRERKERRNDSKTVARPFGERAISAMIYFNRTCGGSILTREILSGKRNKGVKLVVS